MNKKRWRKVLGSLAVAGALCMSMSVTAFADGTDPTQEPITDPIFTETETAEEPVTVEEQTPLTPDGNATLVDEVTEEDGKLFYTFQTSNGNYFYLFIDQASTSENVYMLNLIDEEDLLKAIAEADGTESTGTGTSTSTDIGLKDEEPVDSSGTAEPEPSEEPNAEVEPEPEKGSNTILYVILLVIGGGVIGAFYYIKIVKPKKEGNSVEDDMEFYDDEDYVNEDEAAATEDTEPEFEEDEAEPKDGE
jgi:hypothetical protein